MTNKQPLIIDKGKDCECITKGLSPKQQYTKTLGCEICQGEAKSSTKLIFDAKDFRCYGNLNDKMTIIHSEWCQCKGTGYLLHKKGELRYLCPKCGLVGIPHPHKHCKKFRLSSDAVLKDFRELKNYVQGLRFVDIITKHNLSEDSKIVVCEGYYE